MSILTAKDVTYTYRTRYQTVHALNGVSCEFELGEMAALVGRSGSGKTTLLSLLAGLDLPDTGEVLYGGSPTAQLDRDKYRRQEVAVVYQAFHLFPLLTALENVTYPMELSGVKGKEEKEKGCALWCWRWRCALALRRPQQHRQSPHRRGKAGNLRWNIR